MGEAALRRATYQDILDLPDHVVGEIIDGELIVSPRPRLRHSLAASYLGAQVLITYGRGSGGHDAPGGWWILDEPELHIDGHILVPDVAGWRRTRMPEMPDEAYCTVSPDWVCEVLSPSTARLDRVSKKPVYAEIGVEYLWFVDPAAKALEVLVRTEGFFREVEVFLGDVKVHAGPFTQLELDLQSWWTTRYE